MKSHLSWSYERYTPPFFDAGDIYICRLVPETCKFTFEIKEPLSDKCLVYIRERNAGLFRLYGSMTGTVFTVTGLSDMTDYEFYVTCGEKRSRVRLVRTGACFGTVVNYLHPDDEQYAFSGKYLCSPSVVRHPDGYLLASMDLYAADYPQNLTLIFRSDDNGKTWHHLCELFPCFWGKMFIHKGEVYMFGTSTEYGDMLIGKSSDGGKTWGEPMTLLRGGNGKNGECGIHRNPQVVLYYGGRIWNTLEWGSWKRDYHAAMVASAPEDSDLLNPLNWAFSEPVRYDKSWSGVPAGDSTGTIEGSLVVFPDGKLYNVMRFDMTKTTPDYGMALVYRVDTENPENPLAFARAMNFMANYSKFEIKYDEKTKCYITIATRFRDGEHRHCRNLLSLMYSRDMVAWNVAADIIDKTDCNPEKAGFQYVDFFIEGDDIMFETRIGWNEPHNFHDSNFACFDIIHNFRENLI